MYKGRPREDDRSNEGKTKRNLMSVGGGSLKCKIIEAACKWLLVCVRKCVDSTVGCRYNFIYVVLCCTVHKIHSFEFSV